MQENEPQDGLRQRRHAECCGSALATGVFTRETSVVKGVTGGILETDPMVCESLMLGAIVPCRLRRRDAVCRVDPIVTRYADE